MKYEFKTEPYTFQREALRRGWNKPFFGYLMDRGTGKTKVTIDNAGILFTQDAAIQGMLIIAPNEVHNRWVTEQIPLHLPDYIKRNAHVWDNNKAKTKKGKAALETLFEPFNPEDPILQILSMNVEAFQTGNAKNLAYNFCRAHHVFLVVDESTRIKTPSTKRTKAILKLTNMVPYRRILTGNDVTRSPFDVFSQYQFLHHDFWGSKNYYWFQQRYAEYEKQYASVKKTKNRIKCPECNKIINLAVGRYYNKARAIWQHFYKCPECQIQLTWTPIKNRKAGRMHYFLHLVGSDRKREVSDIAFIRELREINENQGLREYPKLLYYKNLEELRAKIAPHVFRILKKDCMDLPEKIYAPIYCEMNQEQRTAYEELRDNLYTEYEGEELTVANKISLMVRFRQIVGGFFPDTDPPKLLGNSNPKMDRLLYDLEDIDEEAIIIWSVFTAELKFISKTLRKKYPDETTALYYGNTKKSDRKQIIDAFQKGQIRFLVANPATAGTGLNLQRSTLHYYFSDSFRLEDRWQSEDRSHRRGQVNHVVYKDIIIKGTIDDTIRKSRETKTEIADFFREYKIEDLV